MNCFLQPMYSFGIEGGALKDYYFGLQKKISLRFGSAAMMDLKLDGMTRGLLDGLTAGNRASLARAITLVESTHLVKAAQAGFIFEQRTCKSPFIYGNPNWELSLRPVALCSKKGRAW